MKLEASRKSYELAIINRAGTLEDYTVSTTLGCRLKDYTANVPQLRVAKQLIEAYKAKSPYPINEDLLFKKGTVVQYIHTDPPSKKQTFKEVIAVELARMADINTVTYISMLNSVFSQLYTPLDASIPKSITHKQKKLGDYIAIKR
jgi:DNA polymerase elongation subunit (family B)